MVYIPVIENFFSDALRSWIWISGLVVVVCLILAVSVFLSTRWILLFRRSPSRSEWTTLGVSTIGFIAGAALFLNHYPTSSYDDLSAFLKMVALIPVVMYGGMLGTLCFLSAGYLSLPSIRSFFKPKQFRWPKIHSTILFLVLFAAMTVFYNFPSELD
ncbi:MAG: hypothetical protein KC917_20560, partial [Candidatus Omnitrophica bacterium]|nr:hypothetical protein [Candidatus Omnitrophota bacterium]